MAAGMLPVQSPASVVVSELLIVCAEEGLAGIGVEVVRIQRAGRAGAIVHYDRQSPR
jgi:hypothetical protein